MADLRLQMMSRYYLAHSTFISLNALPSKANMRTLLETLSACFEFQNIRFRNGEKGVRLDRLRILTQGLTCLTSRSMPSRTRSVVVVFLAELD